MKSDDSFDAVQTMRRIREEIDRELSGKSFEEQRRYIRERVQRYGPDATPSGRPPPPGPLPQY